MTDPIPRADPSRYDAVQWPISKRTILPPRSDRLMLDMVELVEQRQTRRSFLQEINTQQLGEFLWLSSRSRSERPSLFGSPQESRPCPSAGGMHPIHILVATPNQAWQRYNPTIHSLDELPKTESAATEARSAADKLVEIGDGTLLWLLAEPGKTGAKYYRPMSLVWRDAGVVLGYMSIIAESLKLCYCPLGILGNFLSGDLLPEAHRFCGVGMAVVGGNFIAGPTR